MGLFSNPLEHQYQREAIMYFRAQRREEQAKREAEHREASMARRQAELDAWAKQEHQLKIEREQERQRRIREAEEKTARLPRLVQHVKDSMDAEHDGDWLLFLYGEKACAESSDIYNLDFDDYRKVAQIALHGSTLPERRAAAVIVKKATEIHGQDFIFCTCPREQRKLILSEVQKAFDVCSELFNFECSLTRSLRMA